MRPAPYSVADDIRATLLRMLAYIGALAGLAAAAVCFFHWAVLQDALFQAPSALSVAAEPPQAVLLPASQPASQAAQPAWRTVERPYLAFELLMPELANTPHTYTIQRRAGDGARKDVLTWGDAAAAGPYARVEIFRPGAAGERFLDPASEIAARIVDYALTDGVRPSGLIDSKFGPVPLVDFALAAGDQASREPTGRVPSAKSMVQEAFQTLTPRTSRRCLGFARAFDSPKLELAGWYCGAGQAAVDRATVACMLDRLTVVVADTELDAFFARAELKRTFCGQRTPILAATPERAPRVAAAADMRAKSIKLHSRLSAR